MCSAGGFSITKTFHHPNFERTSGPTSGPKSDPKSGPKSGPKSVVR